METIDLNEVTLIKGHVKPFMRTRRGRIEQVSAFYRDNKQAADEVLTKLASKVVEAKSDNSVKMMQDKAYEKFGIMLSKDEADKYLKRIDPMVGQAKINVGGDLKLSGKKLAEHIASAVGATLVPQDEKDYDFEIMKDGKSIGTFAAGTNPKFDMIESVSSKELTDWLSDHGFMISGPAHTNSYIRKPKENPYAHPDGGSWTESKIKKFAKESAQDLVGDFGAEEVEEAASSMFYDMAEGILATTPGLARYLRDKVGIQTKQGRLEYLADEFNEGFQRSKSKMKKSIEKSRKLGSKDLKPRKHKMVGMTAYHPKTGRTGTITDVSEGLYATSDPHFTVNFDGKKERHSVHDLQLRKSESYVILQKADEPTGDKPHKAYTRTVKGKQQQIKQKSGIYKKEDEKGKDKQSQGKPGEKPAGAPEVGSTVMVGGEQVKVTAVGKDGVTATDEKGDKHLIRHENVQGGEKEEEEEGGKKVPSMQEHLDWLNQLKPEDDKSKEILDSAKKIAKDLVGKEAGKEASAEADEKKTTFKKEDEKNHPVIDEFKAQYDKGGKGIDKTWMVPDPKVDGVYLIFTHEDLKDSPYKAHIFYRNQKDFETVDDVATAIKKYGPDALKKEFEKTSSKENSEPSRSDSLDRKKLAEKKEDDSKGDDKEFSKVDDLADQWERSSMKSQPKTSPNFASFARDNLSGSGYSKNIPKGKLKKIISLMHQKIHGVSKEEGDKRAEHWAKDPNPNLYHPTEEQKKRYDYEVKGSEEKKKKLKPKDLSDKEYDHIEGDPDEKIKTGFTSDEGATELHIYYKNDKTYVSPAGEEYNSEPWKFNGKIDKERVLKEYKEVMGMGEDKEKSMETMYVIDLEKAHVKPFTRVRRGKMERVKGFSRPDGDPKLMIGKIKDSRFKKRMKESEVPDVMEVTDEFIARMKNSNDDVTVDNLIEFMDEYEDEIKIKIPMKVKSQAIKDIEKYEERDEGLVARKPHSKTKITRRNVGKIWNKMTNMERYNFINTPHMSRFYNVGSVSDQNWGPSPHSEEIVALFKRRPKAWNRLLKKYASSESVKKDGRKEASSIREGDRVLVNYGQFKGKKGLFIEHSPQGGFGLVKVGSKRFHIDMTDLKKM